MQAISDTLASNPALLLFVVAVGALARLTQPAVLAYASEQLRDDRVTVGYATVSRWP